MPRINCSRDPSSLRRLTALPVPQCPDCQPLTIFKDTGGVFKNNKPSQLTEYALGAINQNKDPIELNPHNADFDVSYVDTAFLPAAMVLRAPQLAPRGWWPYRMRRENSLSNARSLALLKASTFSKHASTQTSPSAGV
jgi:hypothetical protein